MYDFGHIFSNYNTSLADKIFVLQSAKVCGTVQICAEVCQTMQNCA